LITSRPALEKGNKIFIVMKNLQIPEKGRQPSDILKELEERRGADIHWKEGRTWSLVYYLNEEHQDLLQKAYTTYFSENYLNAFAFPSLKQMESEILSMVAAMLNKPDAVGTLSSGGTESIILAMATYRDWARNNNKGNHRNEILATATVHPAFEKAAHLLGLKLVRVPVNENAEIDISALSRMISQQTLVVVVGAPSYPYGIVDPIEEVSRLTLAHQLPLHVDACVGGFILPWAEKLGHWSAPWDFRVPGVTSISLDIHKFGFSAKGASLIIYRSMEYLRNQFFISTEFRGGVYVSPTILGTRPGGAIAAAWATIQHLGQEGYIENTRRLIEGKKRLQAFFESLQEFELVGEPKLNLMAYRTKRNKPDIFVVADFLEDLGWLVDRQQMPACIHLTVLPSNLPAIDNYMHDVKDALEFALANPKAEAKGNAAMYGMMARIPLRGMVGKNLIKLFEKLYQPEAEEVPVKLSNGSKWLGRLNRFLAFGNRLFSGKI
jgi:sphinganine-1-phosphate aldolase